MHDHLKEHKILSIGNTYVENVPLNTCWASILGDCSGKLSREHLFSASLFSDKKEISVSGFPWCKGETKKIGIANCTSKILCSNHNSLLSPLDSSAGSAFATLQKCVKLCNARQLIEPAKFKVRVFTINGLLLERWFLKTLINLCRESGFHLGNKNKVIGVPSEHYVRVSFGKDVFRGKSGLYLVSKVGDQLEFKSEVGFTPIISESDLVIVGGIYYFYDLIFFLSLIEDPLPENFNWISFLELPFIHGDSKPTWHFKKISFKFNGILSHKLIFKWK